MPKGFTMIGNSSANTVGLYTGDVLGLALDDLYIRDFTGTSSVGINIVNSVGWFERRSSRR